MLIMVVMLQERYSPQTVLRNRVVSDARANDSDYGPLVMSDFAQAMTIWDGNGDGGEVDDNGIDNVLGLLRRDGTRNDSWTPACATCTGNTSLANPINAAKEQAERTAWVADVSTAGLTIGTDW